MKYHTKNLWWRDLKKSILQFIPMIGSHAFLKVLWWNIVHKSRGNIVLKIEQDHVNMKEWERDREIEREREREKEGIAIMCYFFYSTLHSHTTFSELVVMAKKYFGCLLSLISIPLEFCRLFWKKKLCAHICIKDVNVIITAFISLPYIHVSA